MINKILAVISITLMFSGCAGVDNRERIAMATLYPDDVPESQRDTEVRPAPILIAALNEKFPPGTAVAELKGYVENLDGHCEQARPGQPMTCTFTETGAACARVDVLITAQTTLSNKIGHIVAYRDHKAC